MWNALRLAAVMLMPSLLGGAVVGGTRLLRWVRQRRQSTAAVPAAPRPIERVAADVRRLRSTLARYEECAPEIGRGLRLRALRAAYADALTSACQALDVPPPVRTSTGEVSVAETYRVEAQLRAVGLDVRQPAVR